MNTALYEVTQPSRITADLESLAGIVDSQLSGWTRTALGEHDVEGRQWVLRQMKAAGLSARIDAAGNVIGVLSGSSPSAGAIMTGSHTDTVEGGGRFDGNVGVAVAVEIARTLKESGIALYHDLLVVAFFSEEPNRFGLSCVGSRALTGQLSKEHLLSKDSRGETFAEALPGAGIDPAAILGAGIDTSRVRAFVELHIEQGPYLEEQNSQIGLVTSITGISRFRGLFTGRRDHAGTTPMNVRRDAGCAAAATVLAVEAIGAGYSEGRGTTGLVTFSPEAVNVVTEKAELWGEFRSPDLDWLHQAGNRLQDAADREGSMRGVDVQLDWLPSADPVPMSSSLLQTCAGVADGLGLRQSLLYSGAEHDAAIIGRDIPTAMIFIPSVDGRSHCPEEFTDAADIIAGANALLNTIVRIDLGETTQSFRKGYSS